MIHLSVAIGRFVEALFWAILHVAGWITLMAVAAAAGLALLAVAVRLTIRRARRR